MVGDVAEGPLERPGGVSKLYLDTPMFRGVSSSSRGVTPDVTPPGTRGSMDSGTRDARQALVYLVERFGRDLVNDPARLRGLLRDLAGNERLEISLLVAAAESGVAADIATNAGAASIAGRAEQLARRLERVGGSPGECPIGGGRMGGRAVDPV